MQHNNKKISILGDGGWGTTLSILLCRKGFSVSLWSISPDYAESLKQNRENKKFLPGFKIPRNIVITSDINTAIKDAQIIIVAIPSQFLRSVLRKLKGLRLKASFLASVTKGIENKTFKRPSQIIQEELKIRKIAVLSGPTIAWEIAAGLPASAVCASKDKKIAKEAQDIFSTDRFRIYTCADIAGIELGGALKNIIAIAAGISDGLGLGTNAKAALFTRGLVEIKRIGVALGAEEETFNGLSGMGDLVTTCISQNSRNRHVGEEIAKGKKLNDIIKETEMVAEGIETARSVYELSKKLNIDTPITNEVYKVLFEAKSPSEAVTDLMTRTKKPEAGRS
jgi:glycerol-3-phosphate dehydrogenase (NAD(P)+)